MKIGHIIKEERIRNGLSQEEVAKAIGSTKQAVYKYENGVVTNIPMDKIETMANLFGVTPSYLMGWEEENPTAMYDGISEKRRELIEFAMTVPEEKAEMILRVMKSIVEAD